MAENRVMYVGDTFPAALFQISDETGVLNLSSASSVQIIWVGDAFTFDGAGAPIWPAETDPDGVHEWNLSYSFAAGDTAHPDTYVPFIAVTWTTGNIQTFPATDYALQVLAAPVV